MQLSKVLITGVIVASLGTGSVAFAAANQPKASQPNTIPPQHMTHKGFHKFAGPRDHDFGMLKDVASILKVTPQALKTDLQSGKSLVDIAKTKGMSKTTLVNKIEASLKTRLDAAVKAGKLTAAKETQILTKSKSGIETMVDHKGLPKMDFQRDHHDFGMLKDVASILKVTPQALKTDLQSGKSLVDIAKTKGMSKTTLVNKLEASLKTRLDAAVKAGKLTAAKETQILTKSKSRIETMVSQKGFPKKDFKHKGHWGAKKFNHPQAPTQANSQAKGL